MLTMATDWGSVTPPAEVTAVGNMMAGLMCASGLAACAAAAAAKYGDCKGDGMYPGVAAACGKATYPEF